MRPRPANKREPSSLSVPLALKKVGVLPRDQDLDYPVAEVRDLFAPHGIEVRSIGGAECPDGLDLVIALGGDGTVLRAFARFPQRPVLAINFGTVGFLTAGDRKDLAHIVQLLVDGQYFVALLPLSRRRAFGLQRGYLAGAPQNALYGRVC